MLFIDGKIFDVRGDSPQAKEYQSFCKKFDKGGEYGHLRFPILFLSKRHTMNKVLGRFKEGAKIDHHDSYLPEVLSPEFLSYHNVVVNGGHSEDWWYSEFLPEKDKNGDYKFKKSGEWFPGGSIYVNNTEMDKLFFIMTKNLQFKNHKIWLDDRIEIAKSKSVKIREQKEMIETIYEKLSEDNLRIVAQSFGISGVDGKETEVLQNELYDYLSSLKNGYELLMRNSDVNSVTRVKAMIQNAIDNKVIEYVMGRGWYLLDKDGKASESIIKIAPMEFDHKEEILCDFLERHLDYMDTIKAGLKYDRNEDELEPVNIPDNYNGVDTDTVFETSPHTKPHGRPKTKK